MLTVLMVFWSCSRHKSNQRITTRVFTTVKQVVVLHTGEYLVEQDYISFESDSSIVVVDNCANSHIWNDCRNFSEY